MIGFLRWITSFLRKCCCSKKCINVIGICKYLLYLWQVVLRRHWLLYFHGRNGKNMMRSVWNAPTVAMEYSFLGKYGHQCYFTQANISGVRYLRRCWFLYCSAKNHWEKNEAINWDETHLLPMNNRLETCDRWPRKGGAQQYVLQVISHKGSIQNKCPRRISNEVHEGNNARWRRY